MGIRGPKPPDYVGLNFWEFEFYKAFHLLRYGAPLPSSRSTSPSFTSVELRRIIADLECMSPEKYWLTTRRLAQQVGERRNLQKPPLPMDIWWAEQQKKEEIYWLKKALQPAPIETQTRRRKVWRDLVQAETYAALRKACGRWAQLPDVRVAGLQPFASHVLENAEGLFKMKRNKRFPDAEYSDNGRIDYLARGMAGLILGKSPMTAIERLRNLKHSPNGPLWSKQDNQCACWRCSLKTRNEISRIAQEGYDNGLRVFMRLAAGTKVPQEWKKRH